MRCARPDDLLGLTHPRHADTHQTSSRYHRPPHGRRTHTHPREAGRRRPWPGEILGRFERRGLQIRAARLVLASRELGETHYAEHSAKPFFGELVDFITSGPTLAFVLEGEGAIATCRVTIGATNPADAAPGSIRGALALAMPNNLVHGSDSTESAEREIGIWFPDGLV